MGTNLRSVSTGSQWFNTRFGVQGLLHPVSLRFLDPGTEAGFLKQQSNTLVSITAPFFVTVAINCFLIVAFTKWRPENWPNREGHRTVVLSATVTAATGLLLILIALVSRWDWWNRRTTALTREVFATVCCMVLFMLLPIQSYWYSARVLGHVLQDVLSFPGNCDRFSDVGVVLGLVGFNAAFHTVLPVRWCIMWVLDFWCMAVYIFMAFGLQSPERADVLPMRTLTLIGVNACFAIGKRRLEMSDRCLFSSLANERVQRCQSEFQLDQVLRSQQTSTVKSQDAPQARGSDGATVLSVPTTTPTGRIFEAIRQADCSEESLQQLIELGKQEQWLLSPDDLSLVPEIVLGKGAFGVVVAGTLYGQAVAVKLSKDQVNAKHLCSIATELRVLRHIRHLNIVMFHGGCVDALGCDLALVLELVDGPTLEKFVSRRKLQDEVRGSLLLDVCLALRYLHERRPCIIHGDLKASNILIERPTVPRAKLADFGLSRVVTRNARPLGGTLLWMAPELVSSELGDGPPPAPSADIFSFGRLVFFVSTGQRPLQGMTRQQIIEVCLSGSVPELPWPSDNLWLQQARTVSDRCLLIQPAKRPTMQEVHSAMLDWLGPSFQSCAGASQGSHAGGAGSTSSQDLQTAVPWSSGLQQVRSLLTTATDLPVHDMPAQKAEVTEASRCPRVCPELQLTPMSTQVRMLTSLIVCWNVKVAAGVCCQHHALVSALQAAAEAMMRESCGDASVMPGVSQCPRCNVLMDPAMAGCCLVCDSVNIRDASARALPALQL